MTPLEELRSRNLTEEQLHVVKESFSLCATAIPIMIYMKQNDIPFDDNARQAARALYKSLAIIQKICPKTAPEELPDWLLYI